MIVVCSETVEKKIRETFPNSEDFGHNAFIGNLSGIDVYSFPDRIFEDVESLEVDAIYYGYFDDQMIITLIRILSMWMYVKETL